MGRRRCTGARPSSRAGSTSTRDPAPFSWAPERVEVTSTGTLAISSGPVFDPAGNRVSTFISTWRRDKDGVWRVVLDIGCPLPLTPGMCWPACRGRCIGRWP